VFAKLGEVISDEDAALLFEMADKNNDGELTRDELAPLLCSIISQNQVS
jgi:Ca2+-binding EF-hand superfamily protein